MALKDLKVDETIRRRENTSMMTTALRSASSKSWLSVLLWRKLSFVHFRFITEAWSEDISQWISNKEKQFGKIGRDRADMSF